MRIAKRFLLTLICLLVLGVCVQAAGQTGTITLHFSGQDGPMSGVPFRAYQVAERLENGSYAMTDTYAAYPIDLASAGQDWQSLAETFAGYTRRDRLTPSAEGVTDANGMLKLADLPAGLYLVLGDRIEVKGANVLPSECILSVPTGSGSKWIFDVDADVKSEVNPPVGPETVSRRALKIWEDAGYEDERPAEITVQLLRDGEIQDTAVLNKENNWRCVWDALDAGYRWEVVEQEFPGYTVKVEKNGVTFTLTNTRVPSDNPPKDPEKPGGPKDRLPRTGQLWWPVPLLAAVGLILLIVGLRRRRRSDEAQS